MQHRKQVVRGGVEIRNDLEIAPHD
jgi:hypothetical protein